MIYLRHVKSISSLSLTLLLLACSGAEQPMQAQMPAPEVNVITLHAQKIDLTETLPGRVEASRVAEVRARVNGIVEKRLFKEGSDVKAGDVLYKIDDAPYQARYAAALANQAKAKAALDEADYQAKRFQRLIQEKAVSEMDLIRANAQQAQAQAQLKAAEAEVKSSQIDLGYTQVTAPIDGRIGRELVTEGALVSQSTATLLATIQQTDKVFVNFQENSRALLKRYRANEAGQLVFPKESEIQVNLILPDGSVYPHAGRLLFSDINVEPRTGQILLRAEIENPEKLLLPGLFVQVQLIQASLPNAFAVPQRAVLRSDAGDNVLMVGDDNILVSKPVTVVGSLNGQWIITEGIKDGDKVMVDGFQKSRVNAPVRAVVVDNVASH